MLELGYLVLGDQQPRLPALANGKRDAPRADSRTGEAAAPTAHAADGAGAGGAILKLWNRAVGGSFHMPTNSTSRKALYLVFRAESGRTMRMWIEPPDAHSARLWLEGISISLQLWPQPQVSTSELQWLRAVFEAADSNRSGVLERSDLRTLLNAANMAGVGREALEEALGSKRVVRGMRLVGQLNFAQATSPWLRTRRRAR